MMKKTVFITGVMVMLVGLSSCVKRQVVQTPIFPAPQTDETMIWSTHDQRPSWTVSEPEVVDDKLSFLGLSGKYATEKEARDDAYRTAVANVVRYIGTFAQDMFQRLQTSYGLTTDIIDPTNVTRRFEKQLASAFTTHVKAKEWYIEKWQTNKTKETYYLAFVLARVPKSTIDQAYKEAMGATIDDLKKKYAEASEEKAKAQFEKAMKAFEEARKQGFSLEE